VMRGLVFGRLAGIQALRDLAPSDG